MEEIKKSITTFRDLRVYENLYQTMVSVLKDVVPRLPKEEKYDLCDQMRRACKAPPALLAEGFAKRYQPRSWKKYIEDAIGESYEMMNHLTVCIDVYAPHVDVQTCKVLIGQYEIACKQLYKLRENWQDFHEK